MLKRVVVGLALLAFALVNRTVHGAEAVEPPREGRSADTVAVPKAASREPAAAANPALSDERLKAKLRKVLEQKVRFEFTDVPFQNCVDTLGTLTGQNLVIDPAIQGQQALINLKVQDMPVSDALSWLSRLAGAEWELRDNAIYILPRRDAAPPKADTQPGKTKVAAPAADGARPCNRLRVHLANGAEVEADQGVLAQFPGLSEQVLEEFFDPAKDGMLCYQGLPPGRSLENLRDLCAVVAPKARLQMVKDLLLIFDDDAHALHRVATVMRHLLLAQRKDSAAAQNDNRP